MTDKANIEEIIRIANNKLAANNWKVYKDDIIFLGNYVRLFYQAKSLVDHGVFDEEHTIYGIGIFLVHLRSHRFHDVSCVEDLPKMADMLNKRGAG